YQVYSRCEGKRITMAVYFGYSVLISLQTGKQARSETRLVGDARIEAATQALVLSGIDHCVGRCVAMTFEGVVEVSHGTESVPAGASIHIVLIPGVVMQGHHPAGAGAAGV